MRNHEPFPSFSLSLSLSLLFSRSLSFSASPRHSPSLSLILSPFHSLSLSLRFPLNHGSLSPFPSLYVCTRARVRIRPQRVRTYVCTRRAWRPPCGVFPSSSSFPLRFSLRVPLAAKTNRKDGFCFRRNRPVISEKSMATRRPRCAFLPFDVAKKDNVNVLSGTTPQNFSVEA